MLPSKVLLIQVWENIAECIEVIATLGRCIASQNGGKVLSLPTGASYRKSIAMFRPSWADLRCVCFALRITSAAPRGAFEVLLHCSYALM